MKFKQKRLAEITADLRKPARIAAYLLAAGGIRRSGPASGEAKAQDERSTHSCFVGGARCWPGSPSSAILIGSPGMRLRPSLPKGRASPGRRACGSIRERAGRRRLSYGAHRSAPGGSPPHPAWTRRSTRRLGCRLRRSPEHCSDQEFIENGVMLVNALGARYADAGGQPRAMAVEDAPLMRSAHVFVRGNPNSLGEEVPRRFLTVLEGAKPAPFIQGSGRFELARKIASADNPLTARVMVNRLWQHHFGAGLVRTPSDFGTRGDAPTHPELLDFLARQFVADGWSLKKLHRLLMLSRTYQQASTDNLAFRNVDPENRLLWRMNRQRIDFESFRDTVLAVSGQLDLTVGGPPVPLFAQPSMRRRTVYGSSIAHSFRSRYGRSTLQILSNTHRNAISLPFLNRRCS